MHLVNTHIICLPHVIAFAVPRVRRSGRMHMHMQALQHPFRHTCANTPVSTGRRTCLPQRPGGSRGRVPWVSATAAPSLENMPKESVVTFKNPDGIALVGKLVEAGGTDMVVLCHGVRACALTLAWIVCVTWTAGTCESAPTTEGGGRGIWHYSCQ